MQLVLGVTVNEEATFSNFFPGNNQELLNDLQSLWNQKPKIIYLWGSKNSGRSHLLQAACHAAYQQGLRAQYLPLKEVSITTNLFTGMESFDLVCLDDMEWIFGNKAYEEIIFHFYNRLKEGGRRLLMSALMPPAQTVCLLPDLKSRLTWNLIYELHSLTDAQMILALQLRAKNRGMDLSQEVGNYILRHYPRNMEALVNLLEKLDHESLVQQRHITIPFIKEVVT